MPRRRDQAARRQELLAAAVAVINERGPAGVRMKDVARQADLATGSVYYYYDDVDELLHQVHQLASDRYLAERRTATAALADPRDRLAAMIDLGLPRPADEPLSLALYQVAVAKARDPRHAAFLTELCGEQRDLYEEILTDGQEQGVLTPVLPVPALAEGLIALEDGYGLGICCGKEGFTFEACRQQLLAVAAGWTGCADLAERA